MGGIIRMGKTRAEAKRLSGSLSDSSARALCDAMETLCDTKGGGRLVRFRIRNGVRPQKVGRCIVPERDRLSRELSDEEVPDDANETLEEARTIHRKRIASGRRGSGSEDKAGTEEVAREMPSLEARPPLKPPPLKPRTK